MSRPVRRNVSSVVLVALLGSELGEDRICQRTLQHVLGQSLVFQRGLVRWTVDDSRDSFAGRLCHPDGSRNYTLDYVVPKLLSQFSLNLLGETGSSIVHGQEDEEIEVSFCPCFHHSDEFEQRRAPPAGRILDLEQMTAQPPLRQGLDCWARL